MKALLAGAALFVALAAPAGAHVTHVDVLRTVDAFDGKSFGSAGPYVEIDARAYFADAPGTRANAGIVDLDLAPRDAHGEVVSSADVVLYRPKDIERGNGAAIVEVPNRGGKGILRYLDHATAAVPEGDGFLLTRGFTVGWIGWEWDVPNTPREVRFFAPVLTDRGRPITGLVRSDFVPSRTVHEQPIGHFGQTPYAIANPRDPRNVLTERGAILAPRRIVARASWHFSADGRSIESAAGFTPGKIYELVYVAKDPVVTGLGLTALRDVVSYLKHDPHSIAPVKRVLGFGISQSARVLRTMLYDGLNADERGSLVFDGVFADVGGAGRGSFNSRFAQPSRDGPSSSSFQYPTDVFPFTDRSEHDPFGGPDDGLLTHADALASAVKIMYSFGAYEYWSRAASLTHTTADGGSDVALPPDVRIYALAGTQHNPGLPLRTTPLAANRTNPNDFSWALRALVVALDAWVATGAEPPASRYPTIAEGTLVPLAGVKFPAIPGVRFPATYHHDYALDFGPAFATKGLDTIEPPRIGGEYGVRLPQVDADGNDLGGIRMPEVAAPLGTYTGWNMRTAASGLPNELVDFTGSYLPFATNGQTRPADDARLSVAERYPTFGAYLDRYLAAAQDLVRDGYLLGDDLPALRARAVELWSAATGAPPGAR